ncbi:MAG: hypothetical protein PSU94_09715 [Lacunisphaera sp.]|nr:hypothetical protein [Lacunisphaera sp.]
MKTQTSQNRIALTFLLLAVIGLVGCTANTGTITHAAIAHFAFVGNAEGAAVTIDEQTAVTLGEHTKLATEPGRHRVRVSKGEKLVVDREVLVGDQQTMEILIP